MQPTTAAPTRSRRNWLPGLAQLRHYQRSSLRGDLVAGLLVAALAIPQSLGYATVAGVPVQVGLYTLPPALLAYALFGSSRLLYMGPVSTVTVLSGSIVRQLSDGDQARAIALTSALAIVAGVVLLVAGIIRIGWVAQFLSEPIVMGFVTGLVILIVVGEIPGLLGLPSTSGALLDRLVQIAQNVPTLSRSPWPSAPPRCSCCSGGNGSHPRCPGPCSCWAAGSWCPASRPRGGRVTVVGAVPTGVPLPGLPGIGLADIGALITGGVAVAGVGIAEGLAAARTFASSERDRVHDDTELIANGAADVAAGLFGGMGVAGSLSKTAANARAGARTQMSGLAGAVAVLAVLLFATELLAPLPKAVLSAIVVHAVWGLLKPGEFRRFNAVRHNDGIASVVACLGVLLLGPLNGLLLAVGQSLAGLVYRSMQVNVDEMGKVRGEKAAWGSLVNDPDRRRVRRIAVIRPDGPIFWANASPVFDKIRERIDARPDAVVVLLDLEATNQMDCTTAEHLERLIKDLQSSGITIHLVRVFRSVRETLERAGVIAELGESRLWHSISAGVRAAKRSPEYGISRFIEAIEAEILAELETSGAFEDEDEAAAEEAAASGTVDGVDTEDDERILSRWNAREVLEGALGRLSRDRG